ncbi:glutamate--cysteine ligase [bacterium]|nr:glutamate--cysteine ligase [bacterium]
MSRKPLGLFGGFGIELEYMIVRGRDCSVFPVSDRVLSRFNGSLSSEIRRGALDWSNELVLHVIELKTHGPAPRLESLPSLFQTDVSAINAFLEPQGGRLLPTAMHPWMDPSRETRLWPHEYNEVYEAYNRIFGCSGHGWANLQSMHLNLPFADDREFGRLHAAIRLILPLLPALAASSPVVEGRPTGLLDSRIEFYRKNQARVPSLTGSVIPEPVHTEADYRREILARLYRDIAPLDEARCLQHEWLNSRGAIARFERHAIEIRLIDVQECPLADLTVAAAVVGALRLLDSAEVTGPDPRRFFPTDALSDLLTRTIRDGEYAPVPDRSYQKALGLRPDASATAGAIWRRLAERMSGDLLDPVWHAPLKTILDRGPLARRMLRVLNDDFSRSAVMALCNRLADCLSEGRLLDA